MALEEKVKGSIPDKCHGNQTDGWDISVKTTKVNFMVVMEGKSEAHQDTSSRDPEYLWQTFTVIHPMVCWGIRLNYSHSINKPIRRHNPKQLTKHCKYRWMTGLHFLSLSRNWYHHIQDMRAAILRIKVLHYGQTQFSPGCLSWSWFTQFLKSTLGQTSVW